MKTSPALTRWQTAHDNANRDNAERQAAYAAKDRHRARVAETSLCRWVGERMRAYDALSPDDKAIADRIAKESP